MVPRKVPLAPGEFRVTAAVLAAVTFTVPLEEIRTSSGAPLLAVAVWIGVVVSAETSGSAIAPVATQRGPSATAVANNILRICKTPRRLRSATTRRATQETCRAPPQLSCFCGECKAKRLLRSGCAHVSWRRRRGPSERDHRHITVEIRIDLERATHKQRYRQGFARSRVRRGPGTRTPFRLFGTIRSAGFE